MNLTKWKKTLGAALAVLVFAGLAAGCGSDKKQAADKKELTFSNPRDRTATFLKKGSSPSWRKKAIRLRARI